MGISLIQIEVLVDPNTGRGMFGCRCISSVECDKSSESIQQRDVHSINFFWKTATNLVVVRSRRSHKVLVIDGDFSVGEGIILFSQMSLLGIG